MSNTDGKHEEKTIAVEEIWFASQRVLRTALTTALTLLPIIPQIVQIVQGQWDVQWLTAVSVQAVAINAALTRIIAIPAVNVWLTRIGLGSVPKSVAKETAVAQSQELQPAKYEPSNTDYRTEQGD